MWCAGLRIKRIGGAKGGASEESDGKKRAGGDDGEAYKRKWGDG